MTEGRSRRSFRLKVEILEQAVVAGSVPPSLPIIGKLDDLRSWADKGNKDLCSWSSFSVAAPGGKNADLRGRFDKIFPSLVELQTGKKKRGPRPPKKTSMEEWLIRDERDALIAQNSDLIIRVTVLEEDKRVRDAVIASLLTSVAELTAELAKITPLRPAA